METIQKAVLLAHVLNGSVILLVVIARLGAAVLARRRLPVHRAAAAALALLQTASGVLLGVLAQVPLGRLCVSGLVLAGFVLVAEVASRAVAAQKQL